MIVLSGTCLSRRSESGKSKMYALSDDDGAVYRDDEKYNLEKQ